jgi:hypothetical protein
MYELLKMRNTRNWQTCWRYSLTSTYGIQKSKLGARRASAIQKLKNPILVAGEGQRGSDIKRFIKKQQMQWTLITTGLGS